MKTDEISRAVDVALASVFNISTTEVPHDMSHETYEKWDSAAYLMVIFTVEEQFDVQFSTEEVERAMGRQELISELSTRLSS
ncbi:hypothetical protein QT397_01970 (plasmid) [Microbulbifer sp. MKSA007]|nr:hypothetical protein QT397_01970 [Microbulbifer sp. MKSA007]